MVASSVPIDSRSDNDINDEGVFKTLQPQMRDNVYAE